MSRQPIDDDAMDTLFRAARTHSAWKEGEVSDIQIHAIYELMKFGPTSANCCPARFLFIKSKAVKERLKPHLDPGNVDKTMAAPVTAVIAFDLEFYDRMPELFPHTNARSWYAGKPELIRETAFRNGTLQGAYLIMAARALGLDCGPMSGFNKLGVKEEFFKEENVEVNFLCNIGLGDASKLYPRNPRLKFEEAVRIV